MNKWQTFWRSMDEARLIVRVILILGLYALFQYIWFVTDSFFGIVSTAQASGSDASWAQLVPVLTAVTAFVVGNLKIIVDLVTKAWLDYRQSGTDWGRDGDPEE